MIAIVHFITQTLMSVKETNHLAARVLTAPTHLEVICVNALKGIAWLQIVSEEYTTLGGRNIGMVFSFPFCLLPLWVKDHSQTSELACVNS